jgi:hypothetical protein
VLARNGENSEFRRGSEPTRSRPGRKGRWMSHMTGPANHSRDIFFACLAKSDFDGQKKAELILEISLC